MKKIITLLGCSLLVLAGTANAGSGCNYGEHAKLSPVSPVVEGEAQTDPKLLALAKKKAAEDQAKEILQPAYN